MSLPITSVPASCNTRKRSKKTPPELDVTINDLHLLAPNVPTAFVCLSRTSNSGLKIIGKVNKGGVEYERSGLVECHRRTHDLIARVSANIELSIALPTNSRSNLNTRKQKDDPLSHTCSLFQANQERLSGSTQLHWSRSQAMVQSARVRPLQHTSPAALVESQSPPWSMHASTDLDVAKAEKAATTVIWDEWRGSRMIVLILEIRTVDSLLIYPINREALGSSIKMVAAAGLQYHRQSHMVGG
ncbi:hypothetical protein BD769DRAFT_1392634 [Suillus cothurnatus]|nr:hypothetical protein BD769DRAFT_1392634 [Suillus cothurnatus]